MAAQKQIHSSTKMKTYIKHRRIIKAIKSESEYASKARLNINVAGMPWNNMLE